MERVMSRFISDHEDTTTTDGKTITVKYTEPKCEIRQEVYVAHESINEIADAVAKKLQPKARMTDAEKKGKWIDGNKGKWNAVYCPKCSVCGTPFYGIETARYHYCPNCGARMEEE